MTTFSTEHLQKFITCNNLNKGNGIILFNAIVNVHLNEKENNIHSQVQLVLLPNEIALYILEFIKEEFNMNEMYSSSRYHFKCPETKLLEIYKAPANTKSILSIIPL